MKFGNNVDFENEKVFYVSLCQRTKMKGGLLAGSSKIMVLSRFPFLGFSWHSILVTNFMFIAYIRCKLDCDQPKMKETLHEKQ
jgi:hypothetical protein